MNLLPRVFALILPALAGCAGAPTQPPPRPPPPTAAVAATPVVAEVTDAPAPADDAHAKMLEQARQEGYRVEIHFGKKLWCRQNASVGTHISDNQCLTESELEDQLRIEAQNRADWARSRNCGNMTCNGYAPAGK
jgi:hypothetical protein